VTNSAPSGPNVARELKCRSVPRNGSATKSASKPDSAGAFGSSRPAPTCVVAPLPSASESSVVAAYEVHARVGRVVGVDRDVEQPALPGRVDRRGALDGRARSVLGVDERESPRSLRHEEAAVVREKREPPRVFEPLSDALDGVLDVATVGGRGVRAVGAVGATIAVTAVGRAVVAPFAETAGGRQGGEAAGRSEHAASIGDGGEVARHGGRPVCVSVARPMTLPAARATGGGATSTVVRNPYISDSGYVKMRSTHR